MKIEGNVVKGLGKAQYWVNKINNVFYTKTKKKLFLGTLNIKLKEKYLLEPDFIIKKEEFNGTENVLFKKCKILNEEAYIVRAEKNQKGTGDYNLDIIEIVSNINFRKKYNLKDNYKIKIEIE